LRKSITREIFGPPQQKGVEPLRREKLNLLKELVDDDLEQLALISQDTDAKIGHKTADTSFIGYKTHIAMTEERISPVPHAC
jgi:hypothetical protein